MQLAGIGAQSDRNGPEPRGKYIHELIASARSPVPLDELKDERRQNQLHRKIELGAAPLCSIPLGRICSARCCVISLMGVDECMAESRKLAAQARIANGIAPPRASRTMTR
jgi:hypothetical protein